MNYDYLVGLMMGLAFVVQGSMGIECCSTYDCCESYECAKDEMCYRKPNKPWTYMGNQLGCEKYKTEDLFTDNFLVKYTAMDGKLHSDLWAKTFCNASSKCNHCAPPFEQNECTFPTQIPLDDLHCACSKAGMTAKEMTIPKLMKLVNITDVNLADYCVDERCNFRDIRKALLKTEKLWDESKINWKNGDFQTLGHACRLEYSESDRQITGYGCDFMRKTRYDVGRPWFRELRQSREVQLNLDLSFRVECSDFHDCNHKDNYITPDMLLPEVVNDDIKKQRTKTFSDIREKVVHCPTNKNLPTCGGPTCGGPTTTFTALLLFIGLGILCI